VSVAAGVTEAVPCGRGHGLHIVAPEPSVILSEVGLPCVTCQERVELCPGTMVFGLAFNAKVAGTETVTVCGPVLPPGPVAVIENMVVSLTGITAEADVGSAPESSGTETVGVIVTDVAFSVAHVSVVVWPLFTVLGLTLNWVIVGGTGCAT
jgi:hypothetical protein